MKGVVASSMILLMAFGPLIAGTLAPLLNPALSGSGEPAVEIINEDIFDEEGNLTDIRSFYRLQYGDLTLETDLESTCTWPCQTCNRTCTHWFRLVNNRSDFRLTWDRIKDVITLERPRNSNLPEAILKTESGDIRFKNLKNYLENNVVTIRNNTAHDFYVEYSYLPMAGEKWNLTFSTPDGENMTIDPDITACSELTGANTAYTLTQDVQAASSCMTINATNVTLDGQGYSINHSAAAAGALSYGIWLKGYNFTTIKNVVVNENNTGGTQARYGIDIQNANNGSIINSKIQTLRPNSIALYMSNSDFNLIDNNTITTVGTGAHGIYLLTNADSNNLTSNNISAGSHGIYLLTASNNSISNNTISGMASSKYGIYLQTNANFNNVSYNKIVTLLASSYGIVLDTTWNNNLEGNDVNTSQASSYYVAASTGNIIGYNHTITSTNLAEGKPVNYTYNTNNRAYVGIDFTNFGQLIFAMCKNITIRNSNFSLDSLNIFGYSQNFTIDSNNFTTSTGHAILTYGTGGANWLDIKNNTITVTTPNGYGILLWGNNHNITNNTISASGTGAIAINSYASNNESITGNNIYSVSTGVYFSSSSAAVVENNTITGAILGGVTSSTSNRINVTGNVIQGGGGVSASGNYWIIRNNVINTSTNTISGIYFNSVKDSDAINNTIETNGSTSYGIHLTGNFGVNITNNSITTRGAAAGIYFMSSSLNNTISGTRVWTNNIASNAIYLLQTNHNFTIRDSVLNASKLGASDFRIGKMVTGGDWNFTNVTRADGSPINISWEDGAAGNLSMMWYLNASVTNGTDPLSDVNVSCWNVNGTLMFSENTPASGEISNRTLLEFTWVNSTAGKSVTYFTPYSINGTRSGYLSYDNTSVNMTRSMLLNIALSTNFPPLHNVPLLNATSANNYTTDNLTCWNQSTTDTNSDSVKNIYNWLVNNTQIAVLNMPFEGQSNNSAPKEYSGYNNTGNVAGATWNATGGYDRGAYQFDGLNDYIDVGDINTIDNAIQLSGCVWLYHKSIADDDEILSKYDSTGATKGFLFLRDNIGAASARTDTYTIYVFDGDGVAERIEGATDASKLNIWTHVCFTYIKTNTTGLRLYVNGIEDANSPTTTINTTSLDSGASKLFIGQYIAGSFFNGTIDEVMIFNRSLSAEEVWLLYTNSSHVLAAGETEMDDNWKCEVTPNDGYIDGQTLTSNPIIINAEAIVDNTPPDCTYIVPTPANGTNLVQDNYAINITCSESISNATLEFHNSSGKINYTMTAINATTYWFNATGQGNLSTNFTAYTNDTSNNWNKTLLRFVNISEASGIDRVVPDGVGFLPPTPANDTNLSQNNYYVRVSFNDSKPDWCLLEFTNSSGTINYTMGQGANATTYNLNATGQGNYTTHFTAYCNDTSGNWGSSAYRFVNISTPGTPPDLVAPNGVGFIAPTPANDTNLSQDNYYVNVSFNDTNPDSCLLELTNSSGTKNYTMAMVGSNQTNYQMNMTGQGSNMTYFTAYCNDTSNNWGGSAYRFVNISAAAPLNLSVQIAVPGKGMEWMSWSWVNGTDTDKTECRLSQGDSELERFNTSVQSWNRTMLNEGKQYNLSCRAWAGIDAGNWVEHLESTESIFDKMVVNLMIEYIKQLIKIIAGGG